MMMALARVVIMVMMIIMRMVKMMITMKNSTMRCFATVQLPY